MKNHGKRLRKAEPEVIDEIKKLDRGGWETARITSRYSRFRGYLKTRSLRCGTDNFRQFSFRNPINFIIDLITGFRHFAPRKNVSGGVDIECSLLQDMSEYQCESGRRPTHVPHKPVIGVIGASFSVVSIMVANILRLFKVSDCFKSRSEGGEGRGANGRGGGERKRARNPVAAQENRIKMRHLERVIYLYLSHCSETKTSRRRDGPGKGHGTRGFVPAP